MACDLTLEENKQGASDNVKFAAKQDGEGQHAFNLAGWCLSVRTYKEQRYGERKRQGTNKTHTLTEEIYRV